MNLSILHMLSIPQMAASKLPAADAAQVVFGNGQFVTVLALMTLLGLINSVLLGAPRILFAIGRDGLFTAKATSVSAGGMPRAALVITSIAVAVLLLSGTFERILSIGAVLLVAAYCANYAAMIVLRRREPGIARPFRPWGYPWTTGAALAGSLLFLIAAAIGAPWSALAAGCFLAASVPAYWLMIKRKQLTGG